jgi:hypothetical protein
MRILVVVATVALLLGGVTVLPVAAASEVTVSIDALDEVAAGSDFTANINISEVANFDACNYDISFDASVLRLDNVTSGLIGSSEIPVDMYNEINSGTYRVVQNVPGLAGASGSGYLAELHFHAIGGQGSQISLSNGILSNNLAEEITATWAGDSVRLVTTAFGATTPPPAANLSPEGTTPPTAVNPSPEAIPPSEPVALPTEPINWTVLWGVIGGVIVGGIIISLLVKRRAY